MNCAYEMEIKKVHSRVLRWMKNPNQYNAKIFLAFMALSKGGEISVNMDTLKKNCGLDPGIFKKNYNQMKIISEKNHGKVFDTRADGTIELWEPVADFIIQEYKKVFG